MKLFLIKFSGVFLEGEATVRALTERIAKNMVVRRIKLDNMLMQGKYLKYSDSEIREHLKAEELIISKGAAIVDFRNGDY